MQITNTRDANGNIEVAGNNSSSVLMKEKSCTDTGYEAAGKKLVFAGSDFATAKLTKIPANGTTISALKHTIKFEVKNKSTTEQIKAGTYRTNLNFSITI